MKYIRLKGFKLTHEKGRKTVPILLILFLEIGCFPTLSLIWQKRVFKWLVFVSEDKLMQILDLVSWNYGKELWVWGAVSLSGYDFVVIVFAEPLLAYGAKVLLFEYIQY